MNREENTRLIKSLARESGFEHCGISKAEFLQEEAPRLEQWLKRNFHGKMGYLENHFDKRLDPTRLVPGARSVVSLTYNYYPPVDINAGKQYKIAKYAFGKDYHFVIKSKLADLVAHMQARIGDFHFRIFVDSGPVMERQWAQKSGIGWVGKNSLLLNKQRGSFFFLAEIISDLDFIYDGPVGDHCGTCTRCIDACPTDAIVADQVVDASRCISYFTIELKDEIPGDFSGGYQNWIFGCDICQDVCPWNRFSRPHEEPDFKPNEAMRSMSDEDWEDLTEDVYRAISKKSPIKRTKFTGLKRNIEFLKNKKPG